jgi:hypothetical protein
MTEREKLAEAVAAGERGVRGDCTGRDYDNRIVLMTRLVEAARKHLDTLPKTKPAYEVTWVDEVYPGIGGKRVWCTAWAMNRALENAKDALAAGKKNVSIDKIEVPA